MPESLHSVYAGLAASLADVPRQLGRTPRSILMVSAHWEAPRFTLQGAERPGMVYDYYGFPPHTYQIRYASPGAPALAERTAALIRAAWLPAGIYA